MMVNLPDHKRRCLARETLQFVADHQWIAPSYKRDPKWLLQEIEDIKKHLPVALTQAVHAARDLPWSEFWVDPRVVRAERLCKQQREDILERFGYFHAEHLWRIPQDDEAFDLCLMCEDCCDLHDQIVPETCYRDKDGQLVIHDPWSTSATVTAFKESDWGLETNDDRDLRYAWRQHWRRATRSEPAP